MAVLQDPSGGVFSIWQAKKHHGVGAKQEIGSLCWNELYSTNVDAAGKFYVSTFGWKTDSMDMGPMGTYTLSGSTRTRTDSALPLQGLGDRVRIAPTSRGPVMLRSRLLLRIAALSAVLAAVGCHSGGDARSPTSGTETTGADSNAFPEHDARTALNAASRGLKSCRSESGPSRLEASVKFERTGEVTTVDVKPGTEPVAACVREKLAQVAVMPFDGEPVTMSMQVQM